MISFKTFTLFLVLCLVALGSCEVTGQNDLDQPEAAAMTDNAPTVAEEEASLEVEDGSDLRRRLGSWDMKWCSYTDSTDKYWYERNGSCLSSASALSKADAINLGNLFCCSQEGDSSVGFKIKKKTSWLGIKKWYYKCCEQ